MSTLISPKKPRTGAAVSTYLILKKDDSVLLSLRKNTGFKDGFYGLVAGHVEDGEGATTAMIREAHEEAGLVIAPSDLKVVHILHQQTTRFNIDIFFECNRWQGVLSNKEPEKCERLDYFPMGQLPSNTIEYIVEVFKSISKGEFYSERGWQ